MRAFDENGVQLDIQCDSCGALLAVFNEREVECPWCGAIPKDKPQCQREGFVPGHFCILPMGHQGNHLLMLTEAGAKRNWDEMQSNPYEPPGQDESNRSRVRRRTRKKKAERADPTLGF